MLKHHKNQLRDGLTRFSVWIMAHYLRVISLKLCWLWALKEEKERGHFLQKTSLWTARFNSALGAEFICASGISPLLSLIGMVGGRGTSPYPCYLPFPLQGKFILKNKYAIACSVSFVSVEERQSTSPFDVWGLEKWNFHSLSDYPETPINLTNLI